MPGATPKAVPEPAWEIAKIFPYQGSWSEGDYLELDTNHLVELTDGRIEVLPMPTEEHQDLVLYLLQSLLAFVNPRGLGKALMAPLRVRVRPGKIREPDVIFMSASNAYRRSNKIWDGADLVMEVVSNDDRERDYVQKRADYAEGGIREYWIVDPAIRQIFVLQLVDGHYVQNGPFREGDRARSILLNGFELDVSDVFTAAKS